MKRKLTILTAAAAMLSLTSCVREKLYDSMSDYRIEMDLVYDMLYDKPERPPQLFKANFYDVNTNALVTSCIINGTSGYLYNIEPGTYNLLVYDYSTNNTKVERESAFTTIYALTSTLSYRDVPVADAPSHLFVYRKESVEIPHISELQPTFVLKTTPRSIMDSWVLVVDGITGLENADGIEVYITGQAGRNYFGRQELSDKNTAIFFKAHPDEDMTRIYTPFNTFGKLADFESELTLNLFIQGSGGATYICRADVTEQFDDPTNVNHVIHASFNVHIEPREDSGFDPSVELWEPEKEIIEIS